MSDIWQDDEVGAEPEEVQHQAMVKPEALRRIAKARLYEAMLNSEFFSQVHPDDQEVAAEVEDEMRQFIIFKAETLVGLRTDQGPVPISSDFSTTEIAVLKKLAAKVINGASAPTSVGSANAGRTKMSPVNASSNPMLAKPKATRTNKAAKPVARAKSANVSEITGQDYSQVGNPSALPMPSQDVINARYSMEAANNEAALGGDPSGAGELLTAAVRLSQHANRNIQENDE